MATALVFVHWIHDRLQDGLGRFDHQCAMLSIVSQTERGASIPTQSYYQFMVLILLMRRGYEGFGEDTGAGLGGCSRLYSTSTSIEYSYATSARTCVPGTVAPGVAEKFARHVFYQQTDLHL